MKKNYVTICAKCGRGFLKTSASALVDTQPIWWMEDPYVPRQNPMKMLEGPMCNGRLMRVDRDAEIVRRRALEIVPASEVEILDNG